MGIFDLIFGNNDSNNNNEKKRKPFIWEPYVDPEDKKYDSFGSYGTEDDLADWDENDDV